MSPKYLADRVVVMAPHPGTVKTEIPVRPQHGLNKGDYQEVRMDVNNMVAALAAKTVDAMVNVEPYNVIAVADGIGSDLMDFSPVDPMPVFMAGDTRFCTRQA